MGGATIKPSSGRTLRRTRIREYAGFCRKWENQDEIVYFHVNDCGNKNEGVVKIIIGEKSLKYGM